MKAQSKTNLDNRVEELFSRYGVGNLLAALARRCEGEASVAHGEGRPGHARSWQTLAQELQGIETPE